MPQADILQSASYMQACLMVKVTFKINVPIKHTNAYVLVMSNVDF